MRCSFPAILGVLSVAALSVTSAELRAQAPGGRGGPPPRIVSFEAKPATVRPGEPVLLVWQTENPAGVTIDPGIGPVTPRGSRQVTPATTTTYTLSMRNGPMQSVTVTVRGAAPSRPEASAAATPRSTVGAAGNSTRIPRMPDGKPDLTGVYNFAGLPAGTMPPPLKPGAEKFRIVRGPTDIRGRTTLTSGSDCNPLGIPQTYITPYPFQIVQTAKLVVIIYEYPNVPRFIPLDGRPHEVDPDPTWMGSSVGRWDGDTLVIDAIGFNDKTEVHGFMHTQDLHVVERFTRLPDLSLQYAVTVEDPNVWQTPWVIPPRTFPFRPELEWVSEFVCEPRVDYKQLFKKEP